MTTPISIIIPTLHREKPLVALLTYLLEQETYQPLEIIVVDQSLRHQAETDAFLKANAHRFRYFRVDFQSLTKARNYGIKAASHDVILFFDDDVEPQPNCIRTHARLHSEQPELAGVTGPSMPPNAALVRRDQLTEEEIEILLSKRNSRFDVDFAYEACWAVGCNVSYKRRWIERAGFFDENFYGAAVGEDAEFSNRIVLAGGRLLYDPSASARNWSHPDGGVRDQKNFGKGVIEYIDNSYYYWSKIGLPKDVRVRALRQMFWNSLRSRRTLLRHGPWGVCYYYWVGVRRALQRCATVRPNYETFSAGQKPVAR